MQPRALSVSFSDTKAKKKVLHITRVTQPGCTGGCLGDGDVFDPYDLREEADWL